MAGALTAATGWAWLKICEKVHLGELDLSQVDHVLEEHSPTIKSVMLQIGQQLTLR